MGLQRKTGTGIQTQAQQPYKREDHVVWGEKEGLFAPVGILKDFSILMKTLSHYSKSV